MKEAKAPKNSWMSIMIADTGTVFLVPAEAVGRERDSNPMGGKNGCRLGNHAADLVGSHHGSMKSCCETFPLLHIDQ